MESILTSVKKMLGIAEEYEHFDMDIIIHINSTFMILNQIGIGPKNIFTINNKYQLWSDFIGDTNLWDAVKTYMYMRVKMMFDPPASSSVTEAMNNSIRELECRLHLIVESKTDENGGDTK